MFEVHTAFPENVAGKCVGDEPTNISASQGRTLSAVLASPQPSQTPCRVPTKPNTKQKGRQVNDEVVSERVGNEIDVAAVITACTEASQHAAAEAASQAVAQNRNAASPVSGDLQYAEPFAISHEHSRYRSLAQHQ